MWQKIKLHWDIVLITLIFLLGLILRITSIYPYKIIFDYDQTEDLYYAQKIVVEKKPVIIGRPIYGNVNFRHGVLFFYFISIPFALFKGNPMFIALWNCFFNAALCFVLFFLSKKLFKNPIPGLIAGFIVAVSNEFIQYAGWLSNPPLSLLVISLFFLSLWFVQKNEWFFPLTIFLLGLSIQAHLFYLYLFPVVFLFWLIYRPKISSFKIIALASFAFVFSISTFILTEIKLNFSTTKTILGYLQVQPGRASWTQKIFFSLKSLGERTSLNLWPQNEAVGVFLFVFILFFLLAVYFVNKSWEKKKSLLFLLLFFLSPLSMLFLGYHEQPWFFAGILPPLALAAGYVIFSFKFKPLILILVFLIGFANIKSILFENKNFEYSIFKPEKSVFLPSQLSVIDYLYQDAKGKPFAINTVTYPLYYNGMWAYHFNWYGKNKFGYLPIWLGGKQLHPYDSLPDPKGDEKYFYFIVDLTSRIPDWTRASALEWIKEKGKLIEEKEIEGFLVQKRELLKKNNLSF